MTYFGGSDDEVERRLSAFEAAPLSANGAVIREYIDIVVSGRYARLLVRQVQRRLEEGRPWPMSFGSAAELLTHLERISFQLRCPSSKRPKEEEKAFWLAYEASTLVLIQDRLPRLVETNFTRNIRASIGHDGNNVGEGPRTGTPVEEVLASELGKGDLITSLKVAMRMAEEGIDGGIRALRHIVLMAGLRRDMDVVKRVVARLILDSEDREAVVGRIVEALNSSGLAARKVRKLDVVCFSGQYVEGLIDAVSAGAFPRELG